VNVCIYMICWFVTVERERERERDSHVYLYVYTKTSKPTGLLGSKDDDCLLHCNTLQHAATHCNTPQHTHETQKDVKGMESKLKVLKASLDEKTMALSKTTHELRSSLARLRSMPTTKQVWCCSVLQCVTVCCSMLQYVAVCCSVLQYVALCWRVGCAPVSFACAVCLQPNRPGVAVRYSVLQCVAVCCSMLQCVGRRVVLQSRSLAQYLHNQIDLVVQWVALCCSMLQCVAVCCSMLHCVGARVALQSRLLAQYVYDQTGLVLQCIAVCCCMLQCVAVCCSVLEGELCFSLARLHHISTTKQIWCFGVLQCVAG